VTIEHGDAGNLETFKLMLEKGVSLCPTLAAVEAIASYNGWVKGRDPDPPRVVQKHESFKLALEVGVNIVFGGDVGVFPHGKNVWELELMVEYGMNTFEALKAATSGNAKVFELDRGFIKPGMLADIIAVKGYPDLNIKALWNVTFVMKGGEVFKNT